MNRKTKVKKIEKEIKTLTDKHAINLAKRRVNFQKELIEKAELIKIGEDALIGKICKHCGCGFKKETGKERVCTKCQKEIKQLWR